MSVEISMKMNFHARGEGFHLFSYEMFLGGDPTGIYRAARTEKGNTTEDTFVAPDGAELDMMTVTKDPHDRRKLITDWMMEHRT